MVARGEIYWATLPEGAGRRPVCVLTRDTAIPILRGVTCAPVTTTIRDIPTEVPVGADEGLAAPSVISCDNVITVPKGYLDGAPIGLIGPTKRAELDAALRFALDIRF